MRLLLDTHALLWFLIDSPELSRTARAAIEAQDNSIHISVVSLWEMAIKARIGKLALPAPFEQIFPIQLQINQIECLSITYQNLYRLNGLELHHRDPFDRMLIAQALTHDLTVVTRDDGFAAYGVPLLW